ncbi:methyltransferase [Dactylosporangium cerinum]|uniref:Methyltransferase n=1 Tax=Dactylosporangium cerinum TaxID=1434730 RepID=A0ABV9VVB3_9ACTN
MATATETLSHQDTALGQLGGALKAAGYHFTTVTPATHERVNHRPGSARAGDLRAVFGWSRPFGPDVLPEDIVTLMHAAGVLRRDGDVWRSMVRCSTYGGELFFHSAFPPSAPDAVFFGPDTHRTADVTVAHLRALQRQPRRVVDVGCGSGAVAVTVAKHAPEAEVVAVDINPAAVRFARINAALAGTQRVDVRHSDLLDGVDGNFDLIVSNPPFMIDPEGRTYRDGGGPHGHDLPLSILEAAVQRLAAGGSLVLFSGTDIVDGEDPLLAAAAYRLAGTDLRWTYREIDPDVYSENLDSPAYAHAERIALAVLTATRP